MQHKNKRKYADKGIFPGQSRYRKPDAPPAQVGQGRRVLQLDCLSEIARTLLAALD
jgi:hypothetical protein|tara:strand:+ start:2443 stop:2610 length:168 start_codon:yes stop_codon:yes gene_type:complete